MSFSSFTCLVNKSMRIRNEELGKKYSSTVEIDISYNLNEEYSIVQINIISPRSLEEIAKYFTDVFSFIACHQELSSCVYIKDMILFKQVVKLLYPNRGLCNIATDFLTCEERYNICLGLCDINFNHLDEYKVLYKDSKGVNYLLNLDINSPIFFKQDKNYPLVKDSTGEVININLIEGVKNCIKRMVFLNKKL